MDNITVSEAEGQGERAQPARLDGSRALVLDDPGRETWITAEER
jgi:hypothetical protein